MSLEMILKKIDDSRDDIVKDMMDMIRIPSIGPANGGEGEGKRADYLMTLLKGFDEVKRIDVDDEKYSGIQRPNILAVKKELNVPDEIFNVNGGAVALGHPIGCSGARVLTTLVYALKNRNKDVGCGTLCLGGGNAVTMIVRRC